VVWRAHHPHHYINDSSQSCSLPEQLSPLRLPIMTRTERSTFPKAISKDRSESKSGMDKSLRKHGAGTHNWGSLADEAQLEYGAIDDEETEMNAEREDSVDKPDMERRATSAAVEDRDNARAFRRRALSKDGIDLSAIARTSSAVSSSPPLRKSPVATPAEVGAMV